MLFFTSDPHYHHLRALELIPSRPWHTIAEMNQGLIEAHNAVVSHDDLIIVLGDFVMGHKTDTVPEILPKLNGRKILLLGNHDAGFWATGPSFTHKTEIYRNFGVKIQTGCVDLLTLLSEFGESTLDLDPGLSIQLCHFPYKNIPDHPAYPGDRFLKRKPEASPKLLLHGHTHARVARTACNMIHVGVDSWNYTPVSLNQILSLE